MPPVEETKKLLVRINSGGDSCVNMDEVIALTSCYGDKFYNTSLPNTLPNIDYGKFPGPVVFTCNGRDIDHDFYRLEDLSNVMFVRVKVNSWNYDLVDKAVRYYTSREVPVVLTCMRYYTESLVARKVDYEWRKHILNSYWILKDRIWREIWLRYRDNGLVFSCASPRSSLCKDCHNCYTLYQAKKVGYSLGTLRFIKAAQAVNFDPVLAGGKNVFLICPVRGMSTEQEDFIKRYIDRLKDAGKTVHWPAVDTDQGSSEWNICLQNGKAILTCDEVHVFWDPASGVSKFDLGMAFMLNLIKGIMGMRLPVSLINLDVLADRQVEKSFEGLLGKWKHEVVSWHE